MAWSVGSNVTTATVTRNSDQSFALVVTLKNDNADDGDQIVTVTALEGSHISGTDAVTVGDGQRTGIDTGGSVSISGCVAAMKSRISTYVGCWSV